MFKDFHLNLTATSYLQQPFLSIIFKPNNLQLNIKSVCFRNIATGRYS